MEIHTILLIILAAALSLALVVYQYFSNFKKHRSPYIYLMLLRFLGIFGILLLLINPSFTKEEYYLEKSNLVLLVDNSSSISNAGASDNVLRIIEQLEANSAMRDKFEIRRLSFDRDLSATDSLGFDREVTDIQGALSGAGRSFNGKSAAFVLLTDGNQTIGTDYQYFKSGSEHSVFPMVLGDTTRYEDILIEQVNVNKYAFLENQYPVEVFVRYQGENEVNTSLSITVNGITRHRETLSLSEQDNSVKIDVLLKANSVGVKRLRVDLGRLENERNVTNNQQEVAVEIIDEKTAVTIVSDLNHPDMGALKKAIESNNQRRVEFAKSSSDFSKLEETDIFIFYQPTRAFEQIYKFVQNKRASLFTITGPETDWNFLNRVQNNYEKNSYNQTEEVSPVINSGFTTFDISNFSTENFPPLQTTLGDLLITKPFQTIVEQRIKGIEIQEPLLALIEGDPGREVVLFGENIWKWRVQNYRNSADFKDFDELISKLLLYLSSDSARQRLNLDYETIYRDANTAVIRASFFDETFEIDRNATITLFISGRYDDISRQIPMLFKGNYYQADLSGLPSGIFDFTVNVEDENIIRSGQFSILDFDVEKQLMSSDYEKLARLASASGGKIYFPDQTTDLVDDLTNSDRYRPTQKSEQNIVSLIDFKILLSIVITAFTAEWFIRKYNGLI